MHGSFSSSSSSGFAHLYELSYYSGWLTRHVQEPHVWRHVHSCLADANVCAVDAIQRPAFLPEALFKHLNTLQVSAFSSHLISSHLIAWIACLPIYPSHCLASCLSVCLSVCLPFLSSSCEEELLVINPKLLRMQ